MNIVSDDDGEELQQSLRLDGMLSPVIDDWRLHYLADHEAWFGFCRGLNRAALRLWLDHWPKGEGGSSAALLPTAARVLGRAMNAFCAAIILCERGSAIQAAGLARGIAEASFWLAYMAREPVAALSNLEADDLKNFIEREKELQRVFDDPGTVAESKAREADYVAKLAGRKKLNIASIARDHGANDGYLKYRILSGFYGHLSQASLRHNFLKTGENAGLNILGPHAEEIPNALYFAADGLVSCAAAYARIVEDAPAVEAFAKVESALRQLRDQAAPE